MPPPERTQTPPVPPRRGRSWCVDCFVAADHRGRGVAATRPSRSGEVARAAVSRAASRGALALHVPDVDRPRAAPTARSCGPVIVALGDSITTGDARRPTSTSATQITRSACCSGDRASTAPRAHADIGRNRLLRPVVRAVDEGRGSIATRVGEATTALILALDQRHRAAASFGHVLRRSEHRRRRGRWPGGAARTGVQPRAAAPLPRADLAGVALATGEERPRGLSTTRSPRRPTGPSSTLRGRTPGRPATYAVGSPRPSSTRGTPWRRWRSGRLAVRPVDAAPSSS